MSSCMIGVDSQAKLLLVARLDVGKKPIVRKVSFADIVQRNSSSSSSSKISHGHEIEDDEDDGCVKSDDSESEDGKK